MSMPLSYLRSDTLVEPLQCGWYAWTHTVAPAQFGFNLTASLLPMLTTFVANPAPHVEGSEDPKMISGPFVHLPASAVPEIQALIETIKERCQLQIDFAHAVTQFEKHLRTTSLGFSLNATYKQAPAVLAGFIEASYDLLNRPQLRIIEELVYRSKFSGVAAQQMSLTRSTTHDRPFFLNTPRTASPYRLILDIPFCDPRWERLAGSRLTPVSIADLADELGVVDADRDLFKTFFSPECAARRDPCYDGDGVRVRYFGHASVLLQTSKIAILVDTLFASVRDEGAALLTFDDLPDFIDYIFLTHAHADHFSMETLLKLRGRVGAVLVPRNNVLNVADPSMRLLVQALGFQDVRVLDPFDEIKLTEGRLMSLPFLGEHSDITIHSKHTLYLLLNGRSFLFLADSACADPVLYHRIASVIGPVDVMFIGMECDGAPLTWLYGNYLTNRPSKKMDETRKLSGCNAEQAWAITDAIKPKRAYVYAMGQEPWMTFLMGLAYTTESIQIIESDTFVARCIDAGIASERLYGCKELAI